MAENDYALNSDSLVNDLRRALGMPAEDDDDDGRETVRLQTARGVAQRPASQPNSSHSDPERQQSGSGPLSAATRLDPINQSRRRTDDLKRAIRDALNAAPTTTAKDKPDE